MVIITYFFNITNGILCIIFVKLFSANNTTFYKKMAIIIIFTALKSLYCNFKIF